MQEETSASDEQTKLKKLHWNRVELQFHLQETCIGMEIGD